MKETQLTGTDVALDARRLELAANESSGAVTAPAGETMLYVIRGSGTIGAHALARETVVWLDAGERYELRAGAEGLEVLFGNAKPGR